MQTFLLERAASLNSPNLIKFWQQLNETASDLGPLELIVKQELEYLHKFGHNDQAITEKIQNCGATSDYWPYRMMNKAIDQLKQGIELDLIKKQLTEDIAKTKENLLDSTIKNIAIGGILLKIIKQDNTASYDIIRTIPDIDEKLPHLSNAQRDYIKMTANQAYIAGSSIDAFAFSDIIAMATMHYHHVTIDSRTPEAKITIGHSTFYKPILDQNIISQQMFYQVERDISNIQYQEINGIKFFNGITGRMECISTYINDKTKTSFESSINAIEDKDFVLITNAAAECIINSSLNKGKDSDEQIAEQAASAATAIANFLGATQQNLEKITTSAITHAQNELANIKAESNIAKIVKKVFEIMEHLFKTISTLFASKTTSIEGNIHSNHAQDIEKERNAQHSYRTRGI